MARDYKMEYQNYQGTPAQKKARARRNAARAKLKRSGRVSLGDGMDVAHKDNNTKNNSSTNLSVQSKAKNRSFARTKTARRK